MPSRTQVECEWRNRPAPPLRFHGGVSKSNSNTSRMELAVHRRKQWDLMGYPRPESLVEGILYDMECLHHRMRPTDQLPLGLESDRLCDNVG